ncbi:MAG: glycosyltransferase family 2 protein [Calditrichaeota bacterium]|nr:glycosyltransferase family 2 protein [Calditrichota bacterium]
MHKLPVSFVVVTLNEEENLERCLRAVDFCSQVVVVDSGSTDGTLDVAKSYGADIFHRDWTGYADQKNFAAEKVTQPWILCVDADEVVTPELRKSILHAFALDPRCDAFEINRHGVYAGRLINHSGWYPQWRTFIYRKEAAKWVGLEPHPVVEFLGKERRRLNGDLLHYTYRNVEEHMRKNFGSARAAARAMLRSGRKASLNDLLFRPLWGWFRCYVLQRGFLDGFYGLAIANGQAMYVFLKYAYLRELNRESDAKS